MDDALGAPTLKFHVPSRPRRDAQTSSAASSLFWLLTSYEACNGWMRLRQWLLEMVLAFKF